MTRKDEILDLLNRGMLPNTLAMSYLWETFSETETTDLLETARKFGSQKLALDLLTFLYAVAKEKDDWFVAQVLELTIQHPLTANGAKPEALKTLRKHLDKVRASLPGSPDPKQRADQLRRAETNFHAMHKHLRKEEPKPQKVEAPKPQKVETPKPANDVRGLNKERDRLQAEIDQLKNQLASLKREQERMAEEVARLDLDLQRKKARASHLDIPPAQSKKERPSRQPQVKGLDASLDLPDFLK